MIRRLFTRRRIAYSVAGLIASYTLLGFVGVPLAIHYLVLPRVNNHLDGQLALAKARFNPFTLRLMLAGVNVQDRQADTLLSADQFVADMQWSSLWRDGFIFKELSVAKPFIHVGIRKDGQLNLRSLLKPSDVSADAPAPEDTEPAEPLRLAIHKLAVTGGSVLITDDSLPEPFRHHIGPLNMAMDQFDTIPTSRNPHKLVAVSQTGETLEWEGWFNLNPLSSEGTLTVSGITAQQYDPYSQTVANFRVRGGRISVSAEYRIDLTKRPVGLDGSLKSYLIEDAQLAPLDSDQPFLHVGELAIRGAKWDVVERSARIEKIELRDGEVLVHRLADGTLNWQAYFPPSDAAPPAAKPTSESGAAVAPPDPSDPWAALMAAVTGAAGPWDVVIGGIHVDGQTIRWRDDATPRPVQSTLLAQHVEIGEVRSDGGYRLPIKADLRINGAPLTLGGEVVPMPAALNLALQVDGLGLGAFDPYVEQYALKVRFRDGKLFLKGDLTAMVEEEQPPQVTFRGDVRVDDLDMAEAPDVEPILAWKSLGFTQLAFDSSPLAIRIGAINLVDPLATYTINEDGQPAVSSLVIPPSEPAPATTTAAPASDASPQPLPVQSIGELTIVGGSMMFLDKSQQPPVTLTIAELGGRISSLSQDPQSRADIQMTARLQDSATATIAGQVNPLPADQYLNMSVKLSMLPMATFEAFSRRYLGHMIESGMLTFEFPMKIDDRKLDGEIKVALDRFHLGEKVQSEEATKLPVGMALNLLRDTKDMIKVNVPIKGDLDDPEFRVGHLVVQAILNTLTNVAASPFKMIAGAIGAGDADLSGVDFEPGSAALTAEAAQTLDLLARAMGERPALSLQMTGAADRSGDLAAVKKARLIHAIRQAKAQRLRSDDPLRRSPDAIPVDDDYRHIVAERYAALQSGELTAESGDVAVELPRESRPRTRRASGGRMQMVRTRPKRAKTAPPPAAEPIAAPEGATSFAEMEKAVLDAIAVSADDLAALAHARATAAQQHMIAAGVSEDRLIIVPAAHADDAKRRPRVEFNLQ